MKEYVFSFRDNSGQHVARFEGKNETDAFAQLLQIYPDAKKLAAFEMDDTLDKLLTTMKNVKDKSEFDEIVANLDKRAKKNAADKFAADLDQRRRDRTADVIEQNVIDSGRMQQSDWNTICSTMTPEEKKEMYEEFIADAEKNHADSKRDADIEKMFINFIFNVKPKGKWRQDVMTARDLGEILNISHVRVLAIQKQALTKLIRNMAKRKRYPFKITSNSEAKALMLAEYIANPEEFKYKIKIDQNDKSLDEILDTSNKLERKIEQTREAKAKKNEKMEKAAHRAAMAEFYKLEKELNELRTKLNLPKVNEYAKWFLAKKGQGFGNWA